MSKSISIVVLIGCSIIGTTAAQQADQQALIDVFRSGDLPSRHVAINDVLRIPPSQRKEQLWLALANELQRVGAESHRRDDVLVAGGAVPSLGPDHGDYMFNLVQAVGQWEDVRALEPLVTAQGGMAATVPIVHFGNDAVAPLIQAVRNGHRSQHAGALLGLRVLLEGMSTPPYNIPPADLSASSRVAILTLVRELLRPQRANWGELGNIAGLALATGDQELRGQLELLAAEPGLVAQLTGLNDPLNIRIVQGGIRTALNRHPK